MDLSLFYFADEAVTAGPGYDLLLDGARLADRNGLAAVWTPERHFHGFGGRYPNPAVSGAAVAAVTERVGIRAGSVAVPLHHLIRIAEEWAVVDCLSGGRAGLSLASGGARSDFILNPSAYADRKQRTIDAVDALRRLWRGEPYRCDDIEPDGEYQVLPRPVQTELPLWLTTAGDVETFRAAGRANAGVLTHLMRQTLPELAERTAAYRSELAATGSGWQGHVTLMVHTYLDETTESAKQRARQPMERYLISAMGLLRPEAGVAADRKARVAVQAAAARYLGPYGLVGSVESALPTLDLFSGAGVDEIACLIDFGVGNDAALAGVHRLAELNQEWLRSRKSVTATA